VTRRLDQLRQDDVALVHDYLLVLRGAERTFAAIGDCFDGAPIHTLLYDEHGTQGRFSGHPVVPSVLQRTGVRQSGFRKLLPLYPLAVRTIPVRDRRLVVSSSSAFAHGVRVAPDAIHVCYCHSPFRYAWFERGRALAETPRPLRPALRATLSGIRRWDRSASRGVTHYVANSENTRRRIERFYGREASVVHPPVDTERFSAGPPQDYLLAVTEIVPHKRVELAAMAAIRAGRRLKVVGSGPELERLRARYGGRVEFLGRVDDDDLSRLYAEANAFVVANVEEFGIAAVEAQAAGKPVIAARAGGVLETVVEEETGVFFDPDDPSDLTRVLKRFDATPFSSQRIRDHAQRFSRGAFQERMRDEVDRALDAAPAGHGIAS
jgi:glycosyltransferase involved in cell wall biosynthesis